MGNLIRPNQVRVVTKDGEIVVHLTLDLNINLNTGALTVSNLPAPVRPAPVEEEPEVEDTKWEIPDFKVPDTKLIFGKTVGGEGDE